MLSSCCPWIYRVNLYPGGVIGSRQNRAVPKWFCPLSDKLKKRAVSNAALFCIFRGIFDFSEPTADMSRYALHRRMEDVLMTIDHDHDFIDVADEADARRAARIVSLIGLLGVLVLGVGLISLLMYGRILTDSGVTELTARPAITVPQAPSVPQPHAD